MRSIIKMAVLAMVGAALALFMFARVNPFIFLPELIIWELFTKEEEKYRRAVAIFGNRRK